MTHAHLSRLNSRLTRIEITLRVTRKDNRYLMEDLQTSSGGFSILFLSLEHLSILELPNHEFTGDGTNVYPGALKLLRLIRLSPMIRTIRFSQYQPAYTEDKTDHFRSTVPRFFSRLEGALTNLRTLDIGRYTEWIWYYELILEAVPESIEELIMRDTYPTFVCPGGGYRHKGVLRMLCWPAQRQEASEDDDSRSSPTTTTKVGYLPRLTHLKIYTTSLLDWDADSLVELASTRNEICELSYDKKARGGGPSKDLLDRLEGISGLDFLVDAVEGGNEKRR
ncbi:hypothetical protein AAF712_014274 [Marasmius tenuissimus]|uniref:Uncharacterized protein n=1 Tax=Marasmius tenuissimus TaxID=585030 RepID=A0ABR2ZCC5_9AGAR